MRASQQPARRYQTRKTHKRTFSKGRSKIHKQTNTQTHKNTNTQTYKHTNTQTRKNTKGHFLREKYKQLASSKSDTLTSRGKPLVLMETKLIKIEIGCKIVWIDLRTTNYICGEKLQISAMYNVHSKAILANLNCNMLEVYHGKAS